LRINWANPYGPHQIPPIINEFLASTELSENVVAKPYVDSVGRGIAVKACLESFDRLVRTWKDEQRITDNEKKNRLKRKRISKRKTKKWERRKAAWERRADIRARFGDHDFVILEAMSEDETDNESTTTVDEEYTTQENNSDKGRIKRKEWRSAEYEEGIKMLDDEVKQHLGKNARRRRSLKYPRRVTIPSNANDVPILPANIHKWMVAERYRNRFPAAVSHVKDNHLPTEANNADNVVWNPAQWGRDPTTFALVTEESLAAEDAAASRSSPSMEVDDITTAIDPRLQAHPPRAH